MGAKLNGGGKSRYTISQNAAINVTPFVDVMLVLLIIFMVAAPLATKSINLDFPPTERPTSVKPPEPTFISIQNGGTIFIGDRPTTRRALISDLRSSASVRDRIMIRAEAEVPYGDFMGVMNELKANGFRQVGLIGEDIS